MSRCLQVVCAVSFLSALSAVAPGAVKAQTSAEAAPSATVNSSRKRTVADAVSAMGRMTGLTIVADGTVAQTQVATPSEAATPQNVEAQLNALVVQLPKGTTWARLYLPPSRRPYSGEDLAALAQAQARLVGPFGGPATPGTVDVMGQKLPEDKAKAALEALNLKPVYLITNPSDRRMGFGLDADASRWASMSEEEKKAWTERQAARLSNMDSASLGTLFQQNLQIFGSLMRILPPEQRQGLLQSIVGPNGNNIRINVNPSTP